MRILTLIIIMTSFLNNFGNKPIKIEKIELRSVDFNITSIIGVRCNNFENYFKEEVDTTWIYDRNIIEDFVKSINALKTDPMNYYPDVRAKLLFYKTNGKIDTLCMSNVGIVFNGKPMLMNNRLLKLVKQYQSLH